MATQIIRDKRNQIIGNVISVGNGFNIRDAKGTLIGKIQNNIAYDGKMSKLGEYKPAQNATFDRMNRKLGNGDLLMSFFFDGV